MTDSPRQVRQFTLSDASVSHGDCEADPVPALWFQDDDDMYSDSGFIERYWLPLSVAVIAGWGGISFLLVNAFGWMVLLALAGVIVAGAGAAVALVKTSDDESYELPSASPAETDEGRFRNAA